MYRFLIYQCANLLIYRYTNLKIAKKLMFRRTAIFLLFLSLSKTSFSLSGDTSFVEYDSISGTKKEFYIKKKGSGGGMYGNLPSKKKITIKEYNTSNNLVSITNATYVTSGCIGWTKKWKCKKFTDDGYEITTKKRKYVITKKYNTQNKLIKKDKEGTNYAVY